MVRDALADTCNCKVGDLARTYGLENLHELLRRRWTIDRGVRELADEVNRRALDVAVERADADVDVAATYRMLTDEETAAETRQHLERAGVDVDYVEAAFVSHQTVYRHLVDCLDATPPERGGDAGEHALQNVRAAEHRLMAVLSDRLDRLCNAGDLDGEYTPHVEVAAECEACGSCHDLEDLLLRGECDCE